MTDIQCPAYNLGDSVFLSDASKDAVIQYQQTLQQGMQSVLDALHRRYPADKEEVVLNGVPCEVFTPKDGVSTKHKTQVLLHFHGGGFEGGSLTNSKLEGIPVAVIGQIKVISVDYRLAPEYVFPAAVDDALAVYKALLEQYSPSDIGVFGSSAGAQLSSMLLARVRQENLPMPAVLGLLFGGGSWMDGDAMHMTSSLIQASQGWHPGKYCQSMAYFKGVDKRNLLAYPATSHALMASFPPTFLASASRDFLLSSVIDTQRRLSRAGVKTDLQLWDGLNHVFHYNPCLPETDELHRLWVSFMQQQQDCASQ